TDGGSGRGAFIGTLGRGAHGECPPEDELVAQVVDGRSRTDEIEVPGAVGDIAEQHRADEAAFGDDELLVEAEGGIAQHDLLGAGGGGEKIAGRNRLDSGHLQIGAEEAAVIGPFFAGEPARQDLRLLVGRLKEPVADPAMLRALANRVYPGDARLEMAVDSDGAIDLKAR